MSRNIVRENQILYLIYLTGRKKKLLNMYYKGFGVFFRILNLGCVGVLNKTVYMYIKKTTRPNVVIMSEKKNTKGKWRLCADSLTFFNERHHNPLLFQELPCFQRFSTRSIFNGPSPAPTLYSSLKIRITLRGVVEVIVQISWYRNLHSPPLCSTPKLPGRVFMYKREKKSLFRQSREIGSVQQIWKTSHFQTKFYSNYADSVQCKSCFATVWFNTIYT